MSALRRDLIKAVEGLLRAQGVTSWDVDKSSGHHKYRFIFGGVERMYVTSGSPSDRRAIQRTLSSLRRFLGVKREVKKNPENRTKAYRKPVKSLPAVPQITTGRDPWASLAGVEAVPHFGPLGFASIDLDAAARGIADAIVGVAA